MFNKIILTIIIILGVAVGSFFVTSAIANASAPGDALYGFDRFYENFQRIFVSAEESAAFETEILEERILELEQLNASGAAIEALQAAIENIQAQEELVASILDRAFTAGQKDNTSSEQTNARYENHVQNSLQIMEQVRREIENHYQEMDQSQEKTQTKESVMEKIGEYTSQVENRTGNSKNSDVPATQKGSGSLGN